MRRTPPQSPTLAAREALEAAGQALRDDRPIQDPSDLGDDRGKYADSANAARTRAVPKTQPGYVPFSNLKKE